MLTLDFPGFPLLTTERLVLRELSLADAPRLLQIRSDEHVMKYIGRRRMQTIAEAEELINSITDGYNNKNAVLWAITLKDNDILIGTICIWNIQTDHYRAELGYLLDAAHWQKGILSECMDIVLPFGFEKINLHSMEARVNPGNMASIKLLEKFGFIKEAHFRENFFYNGKFEDTAVYSLLSR